MPACERPEADTIRTLCRGGYCFFVGRVSGESVRLKITTSSPLTVLTSWWRLATRTPVISWTIASIIGPRRFDQLGPDLFEQVPALFTWKRLDQVLFSRGQYTLEADHEQIADQMSLYILGAPSHEFLFKATDPLGNGGFDFSLGFMRPHQLQKGRTDDRRFWPENAVPGPPDPLNTHPAALPSG